MVIPAGFEKEINQCPEEDDPTKLWLHSYGLKFLKDVKQVHPMIAAWDLGLGESEVPAWAYDRAGCEAILGDRTARNCAI
jgi:hypothetical protein